MGPLRGFAACDECENGSFADLILAQIAFAPWSCESLEPLRLPGIAAAHGTFAD